MEESLYLLDEVLTKKRGKELAIAEREILQAAWQNKTYLTIADNLYLSENYIKDMAYRLWKQLSQILQFKLTKSNFREIMENQDFPSKDNITIFQKVIDKFDASDDQHIAIVLIVDDVKDNLRFLSDILQPAGYQTRCATTASLALKVVKSVIPDIILLDIKMPKIDGYQLCEIFKQNEKLVDVPIIFLSALHDINDKIRAFEVGGVDYITKPFHPEEVILRVRSQMILQSQKKQLLEEIGQHQETVEVLYKSSSLLASLLNHSPDGILGIECVRNPSDGMIEDFIVLVVNPAFIEIFAQAKDDLQVGNKILPLLETINPQLSDLLIKVVVTGESINQVLKSNLSAEHQQELRFIIVKLGDGCSIVVRNII
ncbi:MAG: response regulator [Microcoleaceae cyanobacterium]